MNKLDRQISNICRSTKAHSRKKGLQQYVGPIEPGSVRREPRRPVVLKLVILVV